MGEGVGAETEELRRAAGSQRQRIKIQLSLQEVFLQKYSHICKRLLTAALFTGVKDQASLKVGIG